MSTQPPEIPGHTLVRRLGKGAMGEVWLGEHKRNKRKVAVKLLFKSELKAEDQERLFLREAEALAGFNHRNIVTIHDNDQVGDVAYLVMELLPGGTLSQRMKNGPLSVAEALAMIVQIADALVQIHGSGLVHRDIKPENIMLRDAGTPVITDFGTAKFLDRSTIYGKEGLVVGSVPYMSPEQISGKELSAASDLYALGICMFELLTGNLPFRGSRDQIAIQHFHADLPKLPAALEMLQPVLDKLLAKKPEDRFASARAFIDALRRVFLGDEALRRQVGYAGTSMAWSSQLRALGFVLDPPQKDEVRRAQGGFIERQGGGGSAGAPESAPLVKTPDTNAAPIPLRSASALPDVTRQPSRRPLIAALVLGVGLLVGLGIWLYPRTAPVATTSPTAATIAKPAAISVSEVIAARDRCISRVADLQALASTYAQDITNTLKAAEALAQLGLVAMDAQRHEEALAKYREATTALEAEALRILSGAEADVARRVQAAVDADRLDEAKELIDQGDAVVEARKQFQEKKMAR